MRSEIRREKRSQIRSRIGCTNTGLAMCICFSVVSVIFFVIRFNFRNIQKKIEKTRTERKRKI